MAERGGGGVELCAQMVMMVNESYTAAWSESLDPKPAGWHQRASERASEGEGLGWVGLGGVARDGSH